MFEFYRIFYKRYSSETSDFLKIFATLRKKVHHILLRFSLQFLQNFSTILNVLLLSRFHPNFSGGWQFTCVPSCLVFQSFSTISTKLFYNSSKITVMFLSEQSNKYCYSGHTFFWLPASVGIGKDLVVKNLLAQKKFLEVLQSLPIISKIF